MLNRNCYKVKAKYSATQRKRTVTIYARNEEQAIENVRKQGFEDPFEVESVPAPAPSSRQLEYAKDLGAPVTPDMCANDVSCLISRYVDDRNPPKQGLMNFADRHDVIFSDWIGKKGLYRAVFDQLPKIDRYAFFCFSIYRYLSEDRESDMDCSPNKDFFYHFANLHIWDEKFEESLINNYEGSDLRFFGTFTTVDNGWERSHYGGSTRTYAFKEAHSFLIGSGLVASNANTSKKLQLQDDNLTSPVSEPQVINETVTQPISENFEPKPTNSLLDSIPPDEQQLPSGCATGCIIFIIFFFIIFFLIAIITFF